MAVLFVLNWRDLEWVQTGFMISDRVGEKLPLGERGESSVFLNRDAAVGNMTFRKDKGRFRRGNESEPENGAVYKHKYCMSRTTTVCVP